MFSGIPGVIAWMDYNLIAFVIPKEINSPTELVFECIQTYGLSLHPEKCQIFLRSVKYLGFVLDDSGGQPDPEIIWAIHQMPASVDVASFRSHLLLSLFAIAAQCTSAPKHLVVKGCSSLELV